MSKKQDKGRWEVNLAVMKGNTTCLHVLECSIYEQMRWKLFQLCLRMSNGIPSRRKAKVKLRRILWTRDLIVSKSFMCEILGSYELMLHINFSCYIDQIIRCVIVIGGDPYLFGYLEDLWQMHTFYIGKQYVELRETRCIRCQMRWVNFNSSNICMVIIWNSRRGNHNSWWIHLQLLQHI